MARPASKYSVLELPFFCDFPYLLPCSVGASLGLLAVLGMVWLPCMEVGSGWAIPFTGVILFATLIIIISHTKCPTLATYIVIERAINKINPD